MKKAIIFAIVMLSANFVVAQVTLASIEKRVSKVIKKPPMEA